MPKLKRLRVNCADCGQEIVVCPTPEEEKVGVFWCGECFDKLLGKLYGHDNLPKLIVTKEG